MIVYTIRRKEDQQQLKPGNYRPRFGVSKPRIFRNITALKLHLKRSKYDDNYEVVTYELVEQSAEPISNWY